MKISKGFTWVFGLFLKSPKAIIVIAAVALLMFFRLIIWLASSEAWASSTVAALLIGLLLAYIAVAIVTNKTEEKADLKGIRDVALSGFGWVLGYDLTGLVMQWVFPDVIFWDAPFWSQSITMTLVMLLGVVSGTVVYGVSRASRINALVFYTVCSTLLMLAVWLLLSLTNLPFVYHSLEWSERVILTVLAAFWFFASLGMVILIIKLVQWARKICKRLIVFYKSRQEETQTDK